MTNPLTPRDYIAIENEIRELFAKYELWLGKDWIGGFLYDDSKRYWYLKGLLKDKQNGM